MSSDNTITINGNKYSFTEGQTVLEVARKNGIYIPTLCHLAGTTNTGACRVCVIEVEGVRNLVASCAMPASKNMVAFTDTPKVIEARRFIIALLMVSGNHNCAARGVSSNDWTDFQLNTRTYDGSPEICDAYGNCVLQELAYRYQAHERLMELRLGNQKVLYPIEQVNPFIMRDFSRCIMCGRCLKACNEVQVNNAISYGYRGMHAKIVTKGDSALIDSDCVFCGECIQACPVAALVEKDVRYNTRYWGMKRVESTCGSCSTGCAINIYVKDNSVVRIEGNSGGAVNRGSLCVKGRYGFGYIRGPERLERPLVKKNNIHEPSDWNAALALIAEKMRGIIKSHGPDAVAGIASGHYANEDAYIMQKFFRTVIGTNNIDNSSRLLDSPAVYALHRSLGLSAMSNSIADIEKSDIIMVVGSDTTESHAVISCIIKRAALSGGAGLIVVDPRTTALARHAKYHLRPRPGTDIAWVYGFIHIILNEKLIDEERARETFANLDDLKKSAGRYTPEYVESVTGIPKALIADAARAYARAVRSSVLYSTGITQQKTGTDNVRALADLAMLCGTIGVDGGGLTPLRGQGNAQGACDMGCLPDLLPGYRNIDDANVCAHFSKDWGAAVPSRRGLTLMEMVKGIEKGSIKALIVMGVDLLSCLPDYAGVEKSLQKLDLLVVHDLVMTDTARLADVVLPAPSIVEREGTITNTARRVQRVKQAIEPSGQSREGWKAFAELSRLMGSGMEYNSAEQIFAEIARIVPGYSGMNYGRIEKEKSLQWTFGSHGGSDIYSLKSADGGKPSFHIVDFKLPAKGEFPFSLVAGNIIKEYYYYSGALDSVKKGYGVMNPEDAEGIGIEDSDTVRITTARDSITFPMMLDPGIPKGMVVLPFHPAKERVNRLISSEIEPVSGIPAYKSGTVIVEKYSK
jgi:formate dehydrogenase alpha subunit